MTKQTDQRPLSPYMIGPYYRPQLTSMLSISSRLTGVFLTVVTAPLLVVWLLTLAAGPGAFGSMTNFLGSWPSKLLDQDIYLYVYHHLAKGFLHLIWDTGRMLELKQVYTSGYIMVASAIILFPLVLWTAVS